MATKVIHGLIIGCVDDSTAARREIARSINAGNWWLDAGNGRDSGQVLIGDVNNVESLQGAFNQETMEVCHSPMPGMQVPSLLAAPVALKKQLDCAEAVEADEQSPIINQAMANLVLQFVYLFLEGTLTWMAAYLDLEAGTMRTVPLEPITIARMYSVKVDTLYWGFKCSLGARYSMLKRR
jgi:hypothetical protein